MEDDITRQVDEVESLSSIYDKQWKPEDEVGRSYSVNIENCVILYVTLPSNYPSQAPPTFQISAPELSYVEKQQMSRILEETYLENIGDPVIFQWIEAIRTYLQDKSAILENVMSVDDIEETNEDGYETRLNEIPSKSVPVQQNVPKIWHGEIIVDRKSTFQGHCAAVTSVNDVKGVMSELLQNKKIANATHNMYAFRIPRDEKYFIQDCEDDGESQAGKRLLQLLQVMDTCGVLVVVSRWYGGIQLGPDRFRHIKNAARQVLIEAGFVNRK